MKKIVIIIAVAIICVVGLLIVLIKPAPALYSNNEVLFATNGTEIFYSNYRTQPEKELNNYSLTICTTNGTFFKDPAVLSSSNVAKQVAIQDDKIEVKFQILSGTSFSFEVQSSNFQTATKTFEAIEYVQPENISVKTSISPSSPAKPYLEQSTLFLVDEQYKTTALNAGFPSNLYVFAENLLGQANFEMSVAESGCLELENNYLSAKTTGSSYLTVRALDGSGATKRFLFEVKFVPATSITGLPEKIEMDMANTTEFLLNTYSVLPAFAKNYSVSFESTNQEIFKVENNKVIALKSGQATLKALLDGKLQTEIPVTITRTLEPEILLSLNSSVADILGDKISFEEDVLTLSYNSLLDAYSTLAVDVQVKDYYGSLTGLSAEIQDPNNAVLTDATTPGFGAYFGASVPYVLNVLHKPTTITVKFTLQVDDIILTKILQVTLKE